MLVPAFMAMMASFVVLMTCGVIWAIPPSADGFSAHLGGRCGLGLHLRAAILRAYSADPQPGNLLDAVKIFLIS
jgi:hypothetical protein